MNNFLGHCTRRRWKRDFR